MTNRVLFTMIVLLGTANAAVTHKHRRPRSVLVLHDRVASSNNQGAKLDSAAVAAVPSPARVSTTFVESHSARVENDLMLFPPTLIGIASPAHTSEAELFAAVPAKKKIRFFAPAKASDDLELRRDRDHLLLFRGPQPQGAAVGLGLAMFGAMTMLSAHAPRPLRILFDGPVHLGPAVFDGGGMGAGIAGRGF